MKKNNKRKVLSFLAVSATALTVTTSTFILEESRLKNLIKIQEKLWNELDDFKNQELKHSEFLTKIVQNILDDNLVLNLFYDTFSKVQTKIDNLKFALGNFKNVVNDMKKLNFEKYNSLKEEVEQYLKNTLHFEEYKEIKKELEDTKSQTDRHVNYESTQEEIDLQVKILQEAFEKAKKEKAIKDNDIRLMAFADYEKELRKLNDFIKNPLSVHEFYNDLHKEEVNNRNKIIENISVETSSLTDILEAKHKLIEELETAKTKAHKISWEELQKVYDEAIKYANETLTTPDDIKTKDLLLEYSKQQYDAGINNEDFEVVYANINNILDYVNAAKIQKQVSDTLRNHAKKTLEESKELANDFINDFSDGKYSDIKKYVSDILATESQGTESKTFDKIYESADKIIEALEAKKAEAQAGYDAQKAKLNKIKDELTDPKYESIKQEITELLENKDLIRNNPDSTTRQILDATEALKNYQAEIENKKQAKDDINASFKNIEDYIKEHNHPEDAESIQKLQKALNDTKKAVENSSDSSDIQDQKSKLEKVFEEVKKEVNATFEKREEQKTEYDEVVENVNDLLKLINANSSKYSGLANELTTTKTETDEVVAKKDTESTSDQIKQAKEKLKTKLDEVTAKKDQIDLDEATKEYKKRLDEVDTYKKDTLGDTYPDVTQKLDEAITKIKEDLKKILDDANASLKDKIAATNTASSKVQEALDKAKEEKEQTDKNRKFREFETLKNKVNDYIDKNLENNNDFDFIKNPLAKSVADESNLVEKDPNANPLEPKENIEVEGIQESIDRLTQIFNTSKDLKELKDNYDKQVKAAKAKLSEIQKPVLNEDDKELYNTLENLLTQSEEFFKNNDNKTKEKFDEKAKELSAAITKADEKYTKNKEKRAKARTDLQAKIDSITKYVQNNLQENKDGTFVTKPEHEHTVNKILKELEAAQGVHDSNSSTEQNLIDALDKLNLDEKVLKASEIFDKKALEAEKFATSLEADKKLLSNDSQKELIDTAKENLDSAIELQKSNKTKSKATEESINKATEDLSQALDEAKKQQLEIFQNAYDNLSQKAKSLLTKLDETNLEVANKHPEYQGIYDTLKAVIDSEDPKALSTSTPKPTIEILKESLPKLQKAYDDAVLAKSKSDFDKVYGDILNKFKDTEGSTKYQNLKNAVIKHLEPQKTIRDGENSTSEQIDVATNTLESQISQLDVIKEKFNEYLKVYTDLNDYKTELEAVQENNDYQEIIDEIVRKLNDYKESTIQEDQKLSIQTYTEYKKQLEQALEDAKVKKAKKDYELELAKKYTDNDFEEKHNGAKAKYNKELETISSTLAEDLKNAQTYTEKIEAYEKAQNALKQAKANVEKNKAIDDYEKALTDANTYKDSLTEDYQKKILYDLSTVITNNNDDVQHINKEQNYAAISLERIKKATKNLEDGLKLAKEQNELVKTQKDIFDKKAAEIEQAKQQYPDSATELQNSYDEEVRKLNEKINANPPTIDADSYSTASDNVDKAIQKAAYDKYQKLLTEEVNP
ncbi:hypothetical protein KQ875_00395 [Mycoplasma zalophi]|uniref:GA module n=1 Tax=Mycoplasma zalophi TaxID=191287 RepID=A0ABS6DP12_9MOLU|nr:hypothetical protein [Mycoplasma zalophi]MBU4692057.1 hypothetical protein [Mycoplasma zalophi]